METDSNASVCVMVRAGIAVSVVIPLTDLDYASSGSMEIRRFSETVPFTISLIRPGHRPDPALFDAFSQPLRQHISLFSQQRNKLLADTGLVG